MNYAIRAMTIADYDAVLRLWQDTEGVGLNESDSRENVARTSRFICRVILI